MDATSEVLVFFAERSDAAAATLKQNIDGAREDARTLKRIEAESKKLDAQLENVLAGIPESSQPANLAYLKKVLQDIATNNQLADEQRKSAQELIAAINPSQLGPFKNTQLKDADFATLQKLAQKHQALGVPYQNQRQPVLAWINNFIKPNPQKVLCLDQNGGLAKGTLIPLAPAEKDFISRITGQLNERNPANVQINWAQINPQLKPLLEAHFESLKPTAEVEDDSTRNVMVQVALQNFNNAINGASASAKAIHDTKKGITDRI